MKKSVKITSFIMAIVIMMSSLCIFAFAEDNKIYY